MSHMLSQRSCPHLVLERGRIGERWRAERWDGLRFQFPNWSVRLPDFPFPHADPDGFATSAEILDYLNAYADMVKRADPVRCPGFGVAREMASGFSCRHTRRKHRGTQCRCGHRALSAANSPGLLRNDDLFQIHASAYKAPDQLPAGAVLIVGSGASGAQIADELLRAGRRVSFRSAVTSACRAVIADTT